MARKRWTAHELKEILGEPYTIGPSGHGESRGNTFFSSVRAVKVGNKELKQGEQLGWMQWNCAGGDALEEHRKAFFESVHAHAQANQRGQLLGPICPIGGYQSCSASIDHEDPNLWIMQRVCRKHYPILGDETSNLI